MSNFTFNFTNKEEYLQYRKDWKADYETAMQNIRLAKTEKKDAMREYNKAVLEESAAKKSAGWSRIYKSYRDLYACQEDARALLNELQSAKEESQRQYLLSKDVA